MSAGTLHLTPPSKQIGSQLAELVRPWRGSLIIIALLVLAGALFELVPPLLMRSIVDDHLAVGNKDGCFCWHCCTWVRRCWPRG